MIGMGMLSHLFAGPAGGSGGLVPDLGIGTSYSSDDNVVDPATAFADLTFSVHRNGTWSIGENGNGTLNGVPLSGNWHSAPHATIGDEYEVQITPTTGTFTNNAAAAFTQINATRSADKEASRAAPGTTNASVTFSVTIRNIGTTSPTASDSNITFNVSATVEI